jgi:predicted AlkP superfamily pyrophosphatase or phosphodiesterase
MIETQAILNLPQYRTLSGDHGYDNANPDMRALFIAHGPAFKRGVVAPEIDAVDIYPLLTRLLAIPALPNDGDALKTQAMLRRSRQ